MTDRPLHPLHIGPHTRDDPQHPAPHAEASTFDREINLRGILITGAGLAALCIAASLLVWWSLRGLERYDERRDVRPTPIEAANPQQPPPAPRLQVAPGFDVRNPQEGGQPIARSDREDMAAERLNEDKVLSQPAWLDQGQGLVRVPIETAMQVIAARGVAPEVVGGHPGAAATTAPSITPDQMRLQTELNGVPSSQRNPQPGATVQNTFPKTPARQNQPTQAQTGARPAPSSQTPPPPPLHEERRQDL